MGPEGVSGRWEGGEWRGLREKGKSGGRGARGFRGCSPARLSVGPGGPGSPSSSTRATPLRPPSPHPSAPHSAPRRVRGNTLPRGLSEPGCRSCLHVPRTLASTPTLTRSRHHRLPPPPAVPRDPDVRSTGPTPLFSGACQSRARVLALTEPRHSRPSPPGSDRTDRQSRHKEETAQGPGRGRERGRERRHPLPKSEAPQSTHTPRGSQGRGCERA